MAVATSMVQVNVRVSQEVRHDAEEQLERVGSSVSMLVRSMLEKVAQGPQACAEVMAPLKGENKEAAKRLAIAEAGWKAADEYCNSLGIQPGQVEKDSRSWGQTYEEAMNAHFAQKGLFE